MKRNDILDADIAKITESDYDLCRKMLMNNPHFIRKNRNLDIECSQLKSEPENIGLDLVQLDDILALVAKNSIDILNSKK